MLTRSRFILAAAAALLAIPLPAQSQDTIRTVLRIRVKPDRVADYRAAIQELNAIMREAGSTRYTYRSQSLSGSYEFVSMRIHSKYSALDVDPTADPKLKPYAGKLAAIQMRLYACSESREQVVQVAMPELSLPRSAELPPMVLVHHVRVRPERYDEYVGLMKSDVLPAIKKSGVKSYTVSRTRFGGSRYEMTTVSSLDNWANFDDPSPMRSAMGQSGYEAFLKKVRLMVEESRYDVYRVLSGLSYLPSAAAAPSGN